jgi:hypothetical protein
MKNLMNKLTTLLTGKQEAMPLSRAFLIAAAALASNHKL